jgi:NAD(P)-dependent dehydrogenase (short-subunit alcohol dehydrogenase family)
MRSVVITGASTGIGWATAKLLLFARMNIDGHFPRWGVNHAEAERTAEAILDLFIAGIAQRPPDLYPSQSFLDRVRPEGPADVRS